MQFSPLLMPDSNIPLNVDSSPTSIIIVSLDTCEKVMKTTFATILLRQSRLAQHVENLIKSYVPKRNAVDNDLSEADSAGGRYVLV